MIHSIIEEEIKSFLKDCEFPKGEEQTAKIAFKEGMNRAFVRMFEESLHGDIKFSVHTEPKEIV